MKLYLEAVRVLQQQPRGLGAARLRGVHDGALARGVELVPRQLRHAHQPRHHGRVPVPRSPHQRRPTWVHCGLDTVDR